jgi:hypothetical protein
MSSSCMASLQALNLVRTFASKFSLFLYTSFMKLRSQTLFFSVALALSYTAGSQAAENSAATLLNASNKTELTPEVAEDTDSTPASETESTLDLSIEAQTEDRGDWTFAGDLRPIFAYVEVEDSTDVVARNEDLGLRARLNVSKRITPSLRLGAGVAGRCTTDDCDLDWVMQTETPTRNGLANGQLTFDELYAHWARRGEQRFDILAGRFQSRFVLRGGVYAKSLDHNDSNNTRITWTDGLHASHRGPGGWRSQFVIQHNSRDGTGSIRRGPINFDDSKARENYLLAFENVRTWGPFVQRSANLSYLPASLLKDNDLQGQREDYWGLVGRLAVRWPQRSRGMRFRGGLEAGYAPQTPTEQASGFDRSGDTGGLAWNVVANLMDIQPGHSLGINYGRTQPGWLLSPQFAPNSELFELRYQWQAKQGLMLGARVRWQEALEQTTFAPALRNEFDFYLRLTWEIGYVTSRLIH